MSSGIAEEGVLRKLLSQMNSHVPARRPRLSELASMPDPHFVGRDGSSYGIDPAELALVRESLSKAGLHDIKLPIVLIADAGHEQSTWRVEGTEECAVVAAVLGRQDKDPRDRLFLYAPHVAELRRRLPTATTCMFVP